MNFAGCFEMLTSERLVVFGVRSAVLDGSTTNTKVLDSGTAAEFQALGAATYGFRATP